jgi:hypothetical protein
MTTSFELRYLLNSRRATTRRLLPALLCAPMLVFAQTTPPPGGGPALTDKQLADIAKQLDQIETQITKGKGDILGTALTKFRAAMAGQKEALALYLDCYKLNHFDRKDLKLTDFQEWKDKNEQRLKDEDFLAGLRLQLEYLVLTIQAQEVKEQKEMGPVVSALQAFLPKAVTAVQSTLKHTASGAVEEKDKDKGGRPGGRPGGGRPGWPEGRERGQEGRPGGGGPGGGSENRDRGSGFDGGGQLGAMLRDSVQDTEFSKAFQLEEHLQRKEWEYAPLDIAGIYELVIFPFYRDQKPTELVAQWDARINAELTLAKVSQSESEFAAFAKERRPELQWQKATYLLEHKINPVLALADMLKIVRENPTHPQAGTWLKTLRSAVSTVRPGASTPAAAPTATPPSASTPK